MKPFYQDAWVTLYHADCREVLPTLAAGSVDLVLTDPPYFLPASHHQRRGESSRGIGNLSILDHFFSWLFVEIKRVGGLQAVWYVFCDGQSYPVFHRLIYNMIPKARCLVWDKGNSINGFSWRHQHELILFAENDLSPVVKTGDGDVLQCRAVPTEERLHPAEKPTELVKRLISKSSTEEDQTILDPFAGSGTTLRAAKDLGRKAIGIEIEERYCEIAARRMEQGCLEFPPAPERVEPVELFTEGE